MFWLLLAQEEFLPWGTSWPSLSLKRAGDRPDEFAERARMGAKDSAQPANGAEGAEDGHGTTSPLWESAGRSDVQQSGSFWQIKILGGR